jgi:hypothetical protein
MGTMRRAVVCCAAVLLAASSASAERLKGFLWEASSSAIVVDGESVRLAPDTRIERPNHKDITARDLRVGWEVEVDARQEGTAWVARQLKVKEARFQEESLRGVVDGITPRTFLVDGDEVRLPKGAMPPPGLKPGMRFEGKGVRLDDRSIELKEGRVLPSGYQGEEAQFMAAANQEIGQIKQQLKKIDDPELQAYVERVGRSLVPKWVDPQQFSFTFTLVADSSLNAFALPDVRWSCTPGSWPRWRTRHSWQRCSGTRSPTPRIAMDTAATRTSRGNRSGSAWAAWWRAWWWGRRRTARWRGSSPARAPSWP